jgi:hypothetical protein
METQNVKRDHRQNMRIMGKPGAAPVATVGAQRERKKRRFFGRKERRPRQ